MGKNISSTDGSLIHTNESTQQSGQTTQEREEEDRDTKETTLLFIGPNICQKSCSFQANLY